MSPLSASLPVKVLSTVGRTALRVARGVRRRLDPPAPTEGVHALEVDGVTVHLDLAQRAHRWIYLYQAFEPELRAALAQAVEPGDVVVDIGGNFGWHSLHLAHRRPDVASIHAFEPGRGVLELFRKSLEHRAGRSRADAPIELRRLALGREPGVAKLKHFEGLGSVNASLYALADLPYTEESVDVVTLDQLAEGFAGPPAVVKCDVEGGEKDVLLGAEKVLSGAFGAPPIWFLEANYETAGMAGYFPWELVDLAAERSAYRGYSLRHHRLRPMESRTALRHGDTLVLAVDGVHDERLRRVERGLRDLERAERDESS